MIILYVETIIDDSENKKFAFVYGFIRLILIKMRGFNLVNINEGLFLCAKIVKVI